VNPLAALYGGAVRARNDLYDRGTLRSRRLQGPVVSVGNLSVGGSGKTPFVIALGELLKQRGVKFDVLSRGYRRASKGVALVDPEGTPHDFGDEPLLIARRLGVPVVVGEERFAAGEFAERKFGPQLHVLDDGFQHRQLARDFDIVLVNAGDANDALLPAGRLREPLSAVARADAVVLTNDAQASGLPLRDQQVWRVRRWIVAPDTKDACFAFCGIARPESFFAELETAGVTLAGRMKFRDHYPYYREDEAFRLLMDAREKSGAAAFVTTDKDAVNLGPYFSAMGPIHVVSVSMRVENAGAVVDELVKRIAKAT
jgi:tetraacyldisaccharide 4'-kinase